MSPSLTTAARNAEVETMNGAMIHRGPDSSGLFFNDVVSLGMRRLAIIDLAGGRQPLFNEAKDMAIVCNGEIYNHSELRSRLISLGHKFSSHSDTEVIIHAYEEYGLACLELLHGMFAFALWDERKHQLVVARDRMGEKPLYYHYDGAGNFRFASELRSLRLAINQDPQLSPKAFNLFLTFQYIPEPITPLEGIQQLPAGSYLLLKDNNPSPEPISYWNLGASRESPDDAVQKVADALDSACLLMGTADVPVGIALSGGIDSSLVAALSARHYADELQAFTIGYAGRPSVDERSKAQALASHLGIKCTEIEICTQQVITDFPALIASMDTPIADIAAYGYFAVCRAAREAGVPVLLSGLGGDELFWGYSWVRDAVNRNEEILRRKGRKSWRDRLFLQKEPAIDFFGVHASLRAGDIASRKLMSKKAKGALGEDLWLSMNQLDQNKPMHLAVVELLNRTWLQSNCLALADRMSMASSVEMRIPLLDIKLIELVVGMRNHGLADWRLPHKALLIEALTNVLPADVLQRDKQGFTPPVQHWMQGIVRSYSPLLKDGYLESSGITISESLLEQSMSLPLEIQYRLVLLECWARTHIRLEEIRPHD
jgi:asparagine synthase (glutamine-hydrolysing)